MKYYYFNSRTKAVSYVLDLRDFLHGEKRDLELLESITDKQKKIIFCEDVNEGYYISTNKRHLIEIIKNMIVGQTFVGITKTEMDLYRDLRKEILAL